MGKSSSSSQANQVTNTTSNDDRIVNESGLVARDSALDFSTNMNDSSTNVFTSNQSTAYTNNNTSNSTSNFSSNYNSADQTSTVSGSYNVTADPLIARAAFDYATNVDATRGEGMSQMLGWAKELTGQSQDNTASMIGWASDLTRQSQDNASDGLSQMLGWAKDLTSKSLDNASSLASRFTDNVGQAYDSARNTSPGGIDNKTMIILGVAAAGALAFAASKRS